MILLDEMDTQAALASYLLKRRKANRYSRAKLAEISTVPASTIKKLLWQSLDDLQKLYKLTQVNPNRGTTQPRTIEEVLNEPL